MSAAHGGDVANAAAASANRSVLGWAFGPFFVWALIKGTGRRTTTDMAISRQALEQMLEPAIEALGFELADLEVHVSKGRGLLRVFIDSENGITVHDCEMVSRQVSSLLDVADPMAGRYTLEVSSPGLDRRLTKPTHFDRFAGAEVQIRLRRLVNGRRRIRGTLRGRSGEVVSVESEGAVLEYSRSDIETVRLVPDLKTPAKAS
ncbi:MAG: hypothetical protein AMXMBFR8_30080 [Nevskiales bacterium]